MSTQENLWAGEFGDEYHQRNKIKVRTGFWNEVLSAELDICFDIHTILEIGAGKGDNLIAMHSLMPDCDFTGVELNHNACKRMREFGFNVIQSPFLDAWINEKFDLVFTRGFLIHVPDDQLLATLHTIYEYSSRYICLVEYFSPERREVLYRGYQNALWTDDFAGRMLESYPDLELLKYGFKYHADDGDDLTYFLMRKTKC